MESLLGTLNSFNVSGQPNSIHNKHPRYNDLYKSVTRKSNLAARKAKILEARKLSRYDILNHMRKVEKNELSDEETKETTPEPMEEIEAIAQECYKRPKHYEDVLMLSEWLEEEPENFENDYLAKLCPVGKRCLVVCAGGRTKMYDRNGRFKEEFSSVFPGGSRLSRHTGYSMFDCIASYKSNRFYIIDMLTWHHQGFIECETSFRFEWLHSRVTEYEFDCRVVSDNQTYPFIIVPHVSCSKASLKDLLHIPPVTNWKKEMQKPKQSGTLYSFRDKRDDIDGILFYYKEGHYTHGQTPLVGWMLPFMLHDILNVTVPQDLMDAKPADYGDMKTFIVSYNNQVQKKIKKADEKRERNRQKKMQENAEWEARNQETMETVTGEIPDSSGFTGAMN